MWGASAVLALLVVQPAFAERMHTDLARDFLETAPNGDEGPQCTFDDHSFPGEDRAVETLPTDVDEEKQQDPGALKPFRQQASTKYEEVGCFSLEEHDVGNGGPDAPERDSFCRDFKPKDDRVKCRSGLPFFRRALQRQGGAEFRKCMEYCLTSGLDIFGLVEPSQGGAPVETVECRCGASKDNLQAWHDLTYKDYLIAELWDSPKKKEESAECPVQIGRYDPDWMAKHGNDGTPVTFLRMNVVGINYMHQIFHATNETVQGGEELAPEAESTGQVSFVETSGGTKSRSSVLSARGVLSSRSNRTLGGVGRSPKYARDCAFQQCAAGKAWGNRIYYAFTDDIDSKRMKAYTTALQRIAAHIPCIEFLLLECKDPRGRKRTWGRCRESDLTSSYGSSRSRTQAPAEGVILVGNREPLDPHSGCYTAGLGFPGRYGTRFINLGWCNSNRHVGSMMHETGHALGMHHEHNRADAANEYFGQGPYLEIFTDAIKERAIAQAKRNYPSISRRQLEEKVRSALYQYEVDETTYMGSTARGGRSPFDYKSIMMYPASAEMRSNRRRTSQTSLSGCHSLHCLDDMMGQRDDYSEEDTLQLRDMYGCFPTPPARCPAIYGSEPVDEDGDCQCPSGTVCYYRGSKGCPFAGQTVKRAVAYFSHGCEDCRCVAPTCPEEAGSITTRGGKVAPPDKDGDCKCPPSTVCSQGSGHCPSSRSNNDPTFFADTCEGCVCKPSCPAESNAVSDFADDDGNCLCPLGTQCHKGKSDLPGCRKSSGWSSMRHFKASCSTCVCKEKPPPPATCARSAPEGSLLVLQAAVSEDPDKMGDCLCSKGTVCTQGSGMCTYSGGKSPKYFSAECLDCQCAVPENMRQRVWRKKPLFLMHDRCENGYIPTKCGATQAQVGRYFWDLEGFGLKDNECGRCVMALQATRTRGSCEETESGLFLSAHYALIGSSSNEDLCCQRHTCEQDRAYNRENPCEDYACGENAECVVTVSRQGEKEAQCMCYEGFGAADNGVDCVPEVPAGSRCCEYVGYYMWVPPQYLERSRYLSCSQTNKPICPTIKGKRWMRTRSRYCLLRDFVYKGDSKTPRDR